MYKYFAVTVCPSCATMLRTPVDLPSSKAIIVACARCSLAISEVPTTFAMMDVVEGTPEMKPETWRDRAIKDPMF